MLSLSLIPLPYKIAIVAVLFAGTWGHGYYTGVNKERDKQIVVAAKQLEAALKTERARNKITLETEREMWAASQKTKVVTKTIVKVIQDEKPSVNCALSTGWVQRHNEASANSLPATPSGNYAAPAGVTADQALEAVAENYGTCYEIRNIALGCQSWIKQQQGVK